MLYIILNENKYTITLAEGIAMDCPTCQGNGDLDEMRSVSEEIQKEVKSIIFGQDLVLWPNTCPICGGSGYLDISF